VDTTKTAVLDSTAHALKFSVFQEMYFSDNLPPEFGIRPRSELQNRPVLIRPKDLVNVPQPGKPLNGKEFEDFVQKTSREIADRLGLAPRR
jgi:threonine synthase